VSQPKDLAGDAAARRIERRVADRGLAGPRQDILKVEPQLALPREVAEEAPKDCSRIFETRDTAVEWLEARGSVNGRRSLR
jgi:hypothetical protein